jgi:hypothetical protein
MGVASVGPIPAQGHPLAWLKACHVRSPLAPMHKADPQSVRHSHSIEPPLCSAAPCCLARTPCGRPISWVPDLPLVELCELVFAVHLEGNRQARTPAQRVVDHARGAAPNLLDKGKVPNAPARSMASSALPVRQKAVMLTSRGSHALPVAHGFAGLRAS